MTGIGVVRAFALGLIGALLLPAHSRSAVVITFQSVPTVGLPGYSTFAFTAHSDLGQIQGFDFASQPDFGFFGPMNQVNPLGKPTIFQDHNPDMASVGADVSQDSQFKFNTSTLTIPAGFASESGSQLRALFAANSPLGMSVPFAQIAVPYTNHVFRGQIAVVNGSQIINVDVFGVLEPEPSGIVLMSLAGIGLLSIRRQLGMTRSPMLKTRVTKERVQ